MALISSFLPGFTNGISQQPFTLRLNTQGEHQENGISTISQGLRKRPPSKHLAKVSSTPISNVFVHTVNRDSTERYVFLISSGQLKVYTIDGVEQTVTYGDGAVSYLTTTLPASSSFAAVTVADYTWIVNKDKTVAASTTLTPTSPHLYEALVNVKSGNYGKTYSITLNGSVVASYTTPAGTSAGDSPYISTDHIAAQLYLGLIASSQSTSLLTWSDTNIYTVPAGVTQANFVRVEVAEPVVDGEGNPLDSVYTAQGITWLSATTFAMTTNSSADATIRLIANVSGSNPWNAVLKGSCIYIGTSTAFTVSCNDGFGNNAMVVIPGKTQKFADLPNVCAVPNVIVQIIGDVTNSFSNYFVKFDTSGGSAGVWKECAAPGISLGLSPTTMPYTVIRNSNGTFTVAKAEWTPRKVGDLTSCTNPSFVGRKLNDVFFYQNRLGFLSDENLVMSESGKYFNMFRSTVTALVDSDPIDVTASHTKVSLLNYAIPFNKSLLIFSDQTQFVVPGDTVLTPTTISLKVSTEYPCDANVKPLSAGRNCYFPVTKGNWAAVREYYTNLSYGSGNDDAMEITAHIPNYIPAGTFKIAGSANEDTFALLTKGDTKSIYMYKYFFTSSNEKAQSAWSRWSFGAQDTILNVDFIQSTMYLVISRPDGVYFESIDCSIGYIGTNEPYPVLLDRKLTITPTTYNATTGNTEIATSSIPYPVTDGTYFIVAQNGSTTVKPGEYSTGTVDGSKIVFKGNFVGSPVTFGRKYVFDYGISTITYKLASGAGGNGGQRSDTEGRLQVRKLSFNYADSGYFRVEVTPRGRDTGSYVYSGKTTGNSSATIGRYAISSGRMIVPILCRNTDAVINVINDSPVPSSLISADWEGFYVKRSSPV